MFDLGWTELLLIGVVALIVVGPKDLPILFRRVGEFVGKAKGMAREFSRAMDQAADDAGVKDVSTTLRSATNPLETSLNGVKKAAKSFTDFDPASETGKLAEERADAARKIHEATAKRASDRVAREKAEADATAKAAEAEQTPPASKDTE